MKHRRFPKTQFTKEYPVLVATEARGQSKVIAQHHYLQMAEGSLHEVTEEIINGQEWGGINFDGDLYETRFQ